MAWSRAKALLGVIGFFIPAEVLSAVLLVFAMENVLDSLFSTYVPASAESTAWLIVYALGVLAVSVLNYASATDEEKQELEDELESL